MSLIGITYWKHEISPVYDVSQTLLLVKVEKGMILDRETIQFQSETPQGKATETYQSGVEWLLCGAISNTSSDFLESKAIRVSSFLCGNIDEILHEICQNQTIGNQFRMPGALTVRAKQQNQ